MFLTMLGDNPESNPSEIVLIKIGIKYIHRELSMILNNILADCFYIMAVSKAFSMRPPARLYPISA